MKCKCGTHLPKDALFCHECGRRVRGRRKLLILASLIATVTLVIQLNTSLANMWNRPISTLLTEGGYIHYIEGGITFAVIGPDPFHVEGVARLAEKGSGRLGYSTCYMPGKGFRPPPSLGAETAYTGTRLASAVEEVWMAGMGRSRAVNVLYNGTHAVITLAVEGLDYMAVASTLSKATDDVCVRVLIG